MMLTILSALSVVLELLVTVSNKNTWLLLHNNQQSVVKYLYCCTGVAV